MENKGKNKKACDVFGEVFQGFGRLDGRKVSKFHPYPLEEVLDYDSNTGDIRWIIHDPRHNIRLGKLAGSRSGKSGLYRSIGFQGIFISSHRIAWYLHYGYWSKAVEIDHIDGDPGNNKINNLRECTKSQNQANRGPAKNNTSGYKGVTWDKTAKKWQSKICFLGKWYFLGRYDDILEAHSAYSRAASKYFGEFARVR